MSSTTYRISAKAALSTDGLVAAEVMKCTTNANNFFDFVRGSLIPNMNPFNGSSNHGQLLHSPCARGDQPVSDNWDSYL